MRRILPEDKVADKLGVDNDRILPFGVSRRRMPFLSAFFRRLLFINWTIFYMALRHILFSFFLVSQRYNFGQTDNSQAMIFDRRTFANTKKLRLCYRAFDDSHKRFMSKGAHTMTIKKKNISPSNIFLQFNFENTISNSSFYFYTLTSTGILSIKNTPRLLFIFTFSLS